MRWNCPHCGTALSVADDKLSNTWSFSKCFQCSGYALVRKSDVNLIKVDDAPKGERIVRPQADVGHLGVSVKTASDKIQIAVQATELEPAAAQIPVDEWQRQSVPPAFILPSRPQAQEPALSIGSEIKWMLPDSPEKPVLIDKDQEIKTSFSPKKQMINRTKLIPLAVGFAAAIAIGSGLMLLQESGRISQRHVRTKTTTAQMMNALQIPDSMKMAPKAPSIPLTDSVQETAMAPARTATNTEEPKSKSVAAEAIAALVVQIRVPTATLRSGPSLNFPITGKARLSSNFVVKDWQGEWFRIVLPLEDGSTEPRFAWVRNDLVRLVTLDHQ